MRNPLPAGEVCRPLSRPGENQKWLNQKANVPAPTKLSMIFSTSTIRNYTSQFQQTRAPFSKLELSPGTAGSSPDWWLPWSWSASCSTSGELKLKLNTFLAMLGIDVPPEGSLSVNWSIEKKAGRIDKIRLNVISTAVDVPKSDYREKPVLMLEIGVLRP